MRRWVKALILGIATAIVGVAACPLAVDLEESWGLHLLFRIRGVRPPPAAVVLVGIDQRSAESLGLPSNPGKWPRAVHARLVDDLSQRGAAVIAFDVLFEDPRPGPDDELLAASLRRAGNVVLAEHLVQEVQPGLVIERVVPPPPVLAEAALGLAPFPLPRVPVRLSQYWPFKTAAGDLPILPVVALQAYARDHYSALRGVFEALDPPLAERLPRDWESLVATGHLERTVLAIREALQSDPDLVGRARDALHARPIGPAGQRAIGALLDVYGGPPSQYLNFYGSPGTVPTISYAALLGAERPGSVPDLRGKAVFVGGVQSQRRDAFHTVFSRHGEDLSGVEVAATVFANLLEGVRVRPIPVAREIALLAAWGLLVGGISRLLPIPLTPVVGSALSVAYLLIIHHEFQAAGSWYPLVVPFGVQVPFAMVTALAWRHADASREREDARRALRRYLPGNVVDEMIRRHGDLGRGDLVFGVCLYTDARDYTPLAERLGARRTPDFMNRYYAAISEPIRRHGGIVQNLVADSLIAVWTAAMPTAEPRARACRAALDVVDAVERFNRQLPPEPGARPLPTRIGLTAGELWLGDIGAGDHYEYRAVGDVVNTAQRLESLNKHLGTRVLATRVVIEGLDGFFTREAGRFLLKGKSTPIEVHALEARRKETTPEVVRLEAVFHTALDAYRQQAWREALALFRECDEASGGDGLSRYYAGLCELYANHPPSQPWEPLIRVEDK